MRILSPLLSLALLAPVFAAQSFVHWETPHVHPLERTPGGALLLAVNTPDNRLEVFDATCGVPILLRSVPVGVDPVSVRARSATEAWVVNHVSDTVSVVDLMSGSVVATLDTDDEPTDVVFAGSPERAFVSCSQANTVLVFDPANLGAAPSSIAIQGEEPRAMAVSADGTEVYVAVHDSGNGSTILGGGSTMGGGFPPNAVTSAFGPYSGQNPPPNDGAGFTPAIGGGLPAPPAVGLIVKQDDLGNWMDDNGGDWTDLVSGPLAAVSGRPVGWTLVDNDLAVIDASTLGVSYAERLMNLCMALAVNPANGEVCVVGTDATNEVRFEPNVNGTFVRVHAALVDPSGTPAATGIVDLNQHLDYLSSTVPQATRDLSLGDPRGVAFDAAGSKAYVTGMGSNNVVVIDGTGTRAGISPTIEVGEGPTGVVVDDAGGLVYVLNKFEASISVVSIASETEIARVPFFDPTPDAVRDGRPHFYGTHETSGLGQASCASCHIDGRMDRLAWDLGDPGGVVEPVAGQNLAANIPGLAGGFEDFHPMKGPMTTQTLQDIIGKEPHHWRGDRDGIEEFNGAFEGLLGDDEQLSAGEMQEVEDFLATIHFPPNPFRNVDNTLPADLPLPGHYTTGRFGPAGLPLPNGDATRGLTLYRPPNLLDAGAVACSTCHTMPTGMGTNYVFTGFVSPMVPLPAGPNGELHHALVSQDGSTNVSMKIPQLRNMYEKVGLELTQTTNLAGFGFLHDGSIDSLARFLNEPIFTTASVQDTADLVAFMLAFAGSDLPSGSPNNFLEPPGTASLDTHAAVGRQTTLVDASSPAPGQLALIATMIGLADAGEVGLVVHGDQAGLQRGWTYVGGGTFQSDRSAETVTAAGLEASAQPGSERTYTVVVQGSEERLGNDRDGDGFFDRDELDQGSDPADAASVPGGCLQPLPVAATNLGAVQRSRSSIHLAWFDGSGNETGFTVERALHGAGAPVFQVVASLPANATGFVDDGLACGETYLYRVLAENCSGASVSACLTTSTARCWYIDRDTARTGR